MPRNAYGAQQGSNMQAEFVYAWQPLQTPNENIMSFAQDAAPPPGAPASASAPARPWVVDCVMASRVLAVLVSVASLACIIAFQASDIDTDGLFALYDTRTLPYNNCTAPGGAPPPFRDSIDAFVANVSAATCADFSDPRSPHGIVWRNHSAVYRYPITVRASEKRRSLWGRIFAYVRPLPLLWCVYVWSFAFQLYYVVQDWARGDPLVTRWVRTLCCCCWLIGPRETHIVPARGFTFIKELASAHVCVYDTDCQHRSEALTGSQYWWRLLQAKPAHGAAFMRWVEYACTSPLQLVFFALLMQNTTVDEAILLCNSQLLLCLLGYAVEAELQAAFGHCPAHKPGEHWHAAEANMHQFRAWFLHLCAWYVHGSLWAIIMGEFWDFNNNTKECIEKIDGAPSYVSMIIISQAFFFASFGAVQFLQLIVLAFMSQTRGAEVVDRVFWWAEAGYGVLNVGSKFCIAVILVANIPGMRSTSGGEGACV